MTKLFKVYLLIFGCLLWTSLTQAQDLPTALPEEVGMSSERLERLSATLEQYVKDGKMAGNVALIARRGKVIYQHAFGDSDLETGKKMTNDAIFRIASQTKAIVSVAVMLLQEEGKLLIADPIGKYLPEWQQTTVAKIRDDGGYDVVKTNRSITIMDLLTHTAGIGYGHGPAKKE